MRRQVRFEVGDEGLEEKGWMVDCSEMCIMGCISFGKHIGVTSTHSAPSTSKAGERETDVWLRSGMKDWKKENW